MRDIDIRRALLNRVREMHAAEADTRYLEELAICGGISRADVAVVNGSLHCYEIKSEFDTLTRLPSQRASYEKAFDFVTLVASQTHVERILRSDVIPVWWGIWAATYCEGSIRLDRVRTEARNPEIENLALAQFLWRDEVIAALEERNLARGQKRKTKGQLWGLLAESLEQDELGGIVRNVLKHRENWKVDTLLA